MGANRADRRKAPPRPNFRGGWSGGDGGPKKAAILPQKSGQRPCLVRGPTTLLVLIRYSVVFRVLRRDVPIMGTFRANEKPP